MKKKQIIKSFFHCYGSNFGLISSNIVRGDFVSKDSVSMKIRGIFCLKGIREFCLRGFCLEGMLSKGILSQLIFGGDFLYRMSVSLSVCLFVCLIPISSEKKEVSQFFCVFV